jgi:ribosome-associated protein
MRISDPSQLDAWIEERFDTAGGPGGQNVNKVSTRATLLLDFQTCPLFDATQRARIAQHCATRLARDGRLRVVAAQQRSQSQNRLAALERMVELLNAALHVPKTRHATRPTAGGRRRRLQAKQLRSGVKKLRSARPGGDD